MNDPTVASRGASVALWCVSSVLTACRYDPVTPVAAERPTVVSISVSPNPHNAISAVAHVRVRGTDSVAIVATSPTPSTEMLTPAVRVLGDSAVVPVLGLLPSVTYTLRAVAYGSGERSGPERDFTTGELPADIPRYNASGVDPSPGFVVIAAGMYGLVLDNTGRVVWYRRFSDGPGLSFVAGPDGHYAAQPPVSGGGQLPTWIALDPLGNVTRRMPCMNGMRARPHDLIAQPDGSYWLLCDDIRTMDLSAIGGMAAARVTGTAVQHVAPAGELLFSWSPFDHFSITDVAEPERQGTSVNWTHGNSIDIDTDGNPVVSFRNLGEVTKLDGRTGNVIWRMGGRRNGVTFVDGATPMFAGQHSARALGGGHFLLLDNVGDPSQTRVKRFVVDERVRTARLTHVYGSTPGVSTQIGGSVQALPGGRTLVSFGTAGRVEEYDADGQVVWRIDGHAGYVFRAQRIRSLYAPGIGTTR